jgi:small subunit ribosomal protein S17
MTAENAMESARGARKHKVGTVVSDRMDKTVVVRVERLVAHPVYKKYVKRRSTYKAHDEKNEFQVGDRVEIVETRPLSKDKRWRVSRLIERPAVR